MAKNFRLELNSAGVVKLLQDPGVQGDLARRANAIAGSAPGEWAVSSMIGFDRAVAFVRTADREAMQTAAEDPAAVIRAIAAGKG